MGGVTMTRLTIQTQGENTALSLFLNCVRSDFVQNLCGEAHQEEIRDASFSMGSFKNRIV